VPGVAVSVVGQNLTDPGHGFLPLMFGGGVGYGSNAFTLEADVMGDFTTYEDTSWRYMFGAEYLAGGQYPLRVGYRYDDGQENHALSAGVGYAAREFSFDLSARHTLGDQALTAFFIGLRYHVESLGLGGNNEYQ
jgi:opacity protein-like surface antigen